MISLLASKCPAKKRGRHVFSRLNWLILRQTVKVSALSHSFLWLSRIVFAHEVLVLMEESPGKSLVSAAAGQVILSWEKAAFFLLIPNTNHPLTWRLYFRPPPPTFAWLKLGSFIRKQSCESGNFPNPHFASPLWSLLAFRYSFWSTFVTERGEDWKAALCVLSIKLGIPAWNCHILEYYYAIVLSKSAASHHISLGCSICHEISPF